MKYGKVNMRIPITQIVLGVANSQGKRVVSEDCTMWIVGNPGREREREAQSSIGWLSYVIVRMESGQWKAGTLPSGCTTVFEGEGVGN